MRVLVVEDQEKIADFTRKGLEEHGFVVDHCVDGETGFERASKGAYDALVLDIMLPGRDGLSVLRGLREKHNTIPVILLTARSELNERIEGLKLGADDYLTKPFFVEELAARLEALIRRNSGTGLNILEAGDLSLDLSSRIATRGDEEIELTAREYSLLEYLLRSPGRTYTRAQISEHVWNTHFDTGTNMVEVAVTRLRKKVDGAHEQKLIETVRGVGYRIRREG